MTNSILKRANETIGVIPKDGQKLTVGVRKLWASILLFSQQQGIQDLYSAKLQDILDVAGLASIANHPEIKKHFVDLRSYTVEWNTRTNDEAIIWSACGLIELPRIFYTKGGPTTVTWKLADEIKAQLVDPQGFYTKFNLETMTKLRLGGSIALYEICSRYANNSQGRELGATAKEPIEIWIPRIAGKSKTSYEYRFFKRGILTPAIEEVNQNTDIEVFLQESRTGRKITDLQFLIKKKQDTEFSKLSAAMQKQLGQMGITKKTVSNVADKYSKEQIATQMSILGDAIKNGKVENPNAFFQTGLKEEWKPKKPEKSEKKPRDKPSDPPLTKPKDLNDSDSGATIKDKVLDMLEALSVSDREALLKEFFEESNALTKSLYRSQYFGSRVVLTAFADWYKARGEL